MKVLILTSQLHSGAAELLGVELAVNLNRRGVHTDIICMYSEAMEGAQAARDGILESGVPEVHFLGLSVRPAALDLLRAIIRLRRLLSREKFDLIESSSPSLGIMASLACIGTSVSHVVGLHQTFYQWEHKSLRERLFAFCVRMRARTRFYAVSEFVRKTWEDYSGISGSRVRVVFNSIPVACLQPDLGRNREQVRREFCVSESSKIALCIGRLASYKRQDVVLDALAPICDAQDLVLLFVGEPDLAVPGTEKMLQEMKSRIAAGSLSSRVKFLGFRPDVYELMAAADVLVHGTGKEAFGLVLAEAMALGLPIVATRVEGIPEVLRDTDSILVPPNDPQQLRQAVLETLALPPERLEKARAKGRLRAQLYLPGARTKNMAELYDDVLSNRF